MMMVVWIIVLIGTISENHKHYKGHLVYKVFPKSLEDEMVVRELARAGVW